MSVRENAFCMLIRSQKTSAVAGEITDTLTENYVEDHQIQTNDLSHVYDSINDYISDTQPTGGGFGEITDDEDGHFWDDTEVDSDEDEDRDLEAEEDNYWLGLDD